MRLIDGDALLNRLHEVLGSMGTPPAYSYKVGIYHGIVKAINEIGSGKFYIPSNQREARLREALENIAFGRVEGDYSDARQYARGALHSREGDSDE